MMKSTPITCLLMAAALLSASALCGQILILGQNFETGEGGWAGQSYTDIGVLTSNPSWGWIAGVNWAGSGGASGSYRHQTPTANGAWFAWSPPVTLQAGQQYYVEFGAALSAANSSNRNRAQVRVNSSINLATSTILLPSTNIITSGAGIYNAYTSNTYTAPATGEYRFAVGDFFNFDGFTCYIDGIRIYQVGTSVPEITSVQPTSNTLCAGGTLGIEVEVSASFDAGNVFTAELSNADGSFSNPVTIGTLTTSDGGVINAVIPANTAEGSGYRIRVVSSSPSGTGPDNGTDISIGQPPLVNLGPDQVACQGANVVLQSGFPQAVVTWNGLSGESELLVVTAGLYTAVVTLPNGCSASDAVQVSFVLPASSQLENSYTLCPGEIVVLNTGNFTSVSWNTGATGATLEVGDPGTYAFVATDSQGCTVEGATTVEAGEVPVVNLGPDIVATTGEVVVLDAGAGFQSYAWSNGSTAQVIEVTVSGVYEVQVTSPDGCEASDAVDVQFVVSIAEITGLVVEVYPNPTAGMLNIRRSTGSVAMVELLDATGRCVVRRTISGPLWSCDLTALSPGAYWLRILEAGGQVLHTNRVMLSVPR